MRNEQQAPAHATGVGRAIIGDGDLDWQALLPHLTDRYTCHLPSMRGQMPQVWGVYYDAERDLVLVSDMNTGLWILRVTA